MARTKIYEKIQDEFEDRKRMKDLFGKVELKISENLSLNQFKEMFEEFDCVEKSFVTEDKNEQNKAVTIKLRGRPDERNMIWEFVRKSCLKLHSVKPQMTKKCHTYKTAIVFVKPE